MPRVSWIPIWFTRGRSPWDDHAWLWISRTGGLLRRDGQALQTPVAAAGRVCARLPLPPQP